MPSLTWAKYSNGSCLLLPIRGSSFIELRAPTGAWALLPEMFTVKRVNPTDVEGTKLMSCAVHICASDEVGFPMLLRMEHMAPTGNLEQLSFWRAAEPGEPFEELTGGVFSSEGWAHIEVQRFSVYLILATAVTAVAAATVSRLVNPQHHLYHVCATVLYKKADVENKVLVRACLTPAGVPPSHAADEKPCFHGLRCVERNAEIEMAIESTGTPPIRLEFQPWRNTAQEKMIKDPIYGPPCIQWRSNPEVANYGEPITSSWCGRVFLSYRVATDQQLVESIFDKLRAEHINVWWDAECLEFGEKWEQGFVDGLRRCDIFVPVMSKAALAPFSELTGSSRCDNVLLEYRLAIELMHPRGRIRSILPIFVGELSNGSYGNFFQGGGLPNAPDVVVNNVETKVQHYLLSSSLPSQTPNGMTVSQVMEYMTALQGPRLEGERRLALKDVIQKVADKSRELGV